MHPLILVEGLTGSGKSMMAHFLARQLTYNGIDSVWVHEGEINHPTLVEFESRIQEYMMLSLHNWDEFVRQILETKQPHIVEAAFFNNLLETLFANNLDEGVIIAYAHRLLEVIDPVTPLLIYLAQPDVTGALVKNFENRGEKFRSFVEAFACGTPYAKRRNLTGHDGMITFWKDFVRLTDTLYEDLDFRKFKLDVSGDRWDDYYQEITEALHLSFIPDPLISEEEAQKYIGKYVQGEDSRVFTISFQDGKLLVDVFLDVASPLIKETDNTFAVSGWHFKVYFEENELGKFHRIHIGGKDIDYLKLVGVVAEKSN